LQIIYKPLDIYGQNLADGTKPGSNFQLKMVIAVTTI